MVKTKKGVQIFKFHRGFERLLLSILLSHIIVPFFILITKIWQLKLSNTKLIMYIRINYVFTYYYHFVHQGNQWKLNKEMIRKLQNSVFKESWFWILTSLFNFKSCMFGQARCVDPTIDIMKVGHCHTGTTHPPHVTTTVPTTTTTMDYQMQLVCANAALITCTNEISLICGSDYKLYQNR